MAISLVAVGQKWTATIANTIIAAVNAISSNVVTPTSVAGTGVSLSGAKVVVSAATSVTVNGCFTSTYDWYEVTYDLTTSAGAGINAQLALVGTAAATAYDNQRKTAINATEAAVQALNTTAMQISPINLTAQHTGKMFLFNPAKAQNTSGRAHTLVSPAAAMTTSSGISDVGFQHRTATAYDGIVVTPSSGFLTGTIRITGIA